MKAKERYTLVSDMLFNFFYFFVIRKVRKLLIFYLIFLFIPTVIFAENIVIDRLVAYVDDYAITLSELEAEYERMHKNNLLITKKEVLQTIINKILLIKEARKLRLELGSEDELINQYIEIVIKSKLLVKEEEVHEFYKKNIESFKERDYLSVKDQIEILLFEKEFNELLKSHIKELRRKANIKVFLNDIDTSLKR
ncbi:MAG: SurA N-terminal domain-containing protein [Thermodesulfovibrionales bacterium]|nr:SurA N-terminal domain-containing protein [Thermodesulfovibrionales bacterium]